MSGDNVRRRPAGSAAGTVTEQYCFGATNEQFEGSFDTREEALATAVNETELETVYTGRCQLFEAEVDGVQAIEQVKSDAFERVGHVMEGWLDTYDPEQLEQLSRRLTATLIEWLDEHDMLPSFYSVTEIQAHSASRAA